MSRRQHRIVPIIPCHGGGPGTWNIYNKLLEGKYLRFTSNLFGSIPRSWNHDIDAKRHEDTCCSEAEGLKMVEN